MTAEQWMHRAFQLCDELTAAQRRYDTANHFERAQAFEALASKLGEAKRWMRFHPNTPPSEPASSDRKEPTPWHPV